MVKYRGLYPCYDDSIILTKAVCPILPRIKHETIKIPRRTGVLTIDKTHDERPIALTYELNGKSAERNKELAAALARWAEGETDGKMVFDESPNIYYLACLANATDPDYAEAFPSITLSFVCANPYGISEETSEATTGEYILYLGDVPVNPLIIFTPDQDTTELSWTIDERTFYLEGYILLAGDTLIIDNANKVATVNGNSVMEYMPMAADWLFIPCGSVEFTGSGGVASWRNLYL